MARKKTSAHDELERLEKRIADARVAEREGEQAYRAAEAAAEDARDAVREAHDLGADASGPTRNLDKAKRDAEHAALAWEGVTQRVKGASDSRDRFMAENGEQLLDELRSDNDRAAANLRQAAEALLAADAEWSAQSQQVARFLRGMSLSPAENAPGQHELAGVIRDLRRSLGNEITPPTPHLRQRAFDREERERRFSLRRAREREAGVAS